MAKTKKNLVPAFLCREFGSPEQVEMFVNQAVADGFRILAIEQSQNEFFRNYTVRLAHMSALANLDALDEAHGQAWRRAFGLDPGTSTATNKPMAPANPKTNSLKRSIYRKVEYTRPGVLAFRQGKQ